jgi:ABC-type phosphate transport system substrate-binding protein
MSNIPIDAKPTWPNQTDTSSILFISGSDAISQTVQLTSYTIAYNTQQSSLRLEKNIASIINKAGVKITPNSTTIKSSQIDSKDLFEPNFSADIGDSSGANSYPLSIYTYILFKSENNSNCATTRELYYYLLYFYQNSDAQKIISENSFVPLDTTITNLVLNKINAIKCLGNSLAVRK